MYEDNYYQIESFEENNWWYRARRDLLDNILKSLDTVFDNTLDAGCGVGSNFEVFTKYSRNVYGIDISNDAIELCSHKNYRRLTRMSLLDLNLDVEFDLIACMDVLEHVDDDMEALKNLSSHVRTNGFLILSVPAHRFLWNDNDRFGGHLRRYALSDIRRIANSNSLTILKLSYWNQLMFFPSLVYCTVRLLRKERGLKNNLTLIPDVFNEALYKMLRAENRLFVKYGLLVGVSIFCLCQNNDETLKYGVGCHSKQN